MTMSIISDSPLSEVFSELTSVVCCVGHHRSTTPPPPPAHPVGLAQLIVDVTLSAPPPVWVVHYEEQSGKKAHLNGKNKELQMINISDGCLARSGCSPEKLRCPMTQ